MKKSYVPVTLNEYLSESKSITLKRGYGDRKPIVVGANAPLRNQVLNFVSENKKVSKGKLKKFITNLNESSKNPTAATSMWIKRNAKFFVTENKNGVTYYKLSNIGKRLANNLIANDDVSESNFKLRKRIDEMSPKRKAYEEDIDIDIDDEEELKPGSYDFVDRKKGYERPGIYDEMDEECDEDADEDEKLDEATKARIKKIIENIKAKRSKKLNEEEEEAEADLEAEESDELNFDDLELGDDEESEEGEGEESEESEESEENEESEEDEGEAAKGEGEDVEKVEITEFVITVDDTEEAISELKDLGVTAEEVVDEEGETIEDQIKVSSEDWDSLKGWLEEKGVDIEEMFGGEIEVEEEPEELEGPEGEDLEDDSDLEGEEFDLELEGPEGEEGELDLEGPEGEEGKDELNLDLEDDEDVEESVTGMEREEREKTPNLVQGKEVTIKIK